MEHNSQNSSGVFMSRSEDNNIQTPEQSQQQPGLGSRNSTMTTKEGEGAFENDMSAHTGYVEMMDTAGLQPPPPPQPVRPGVDPFVNQLTPGEIAQLKALIARNDLQSLAATTMDSDYPEFGESTHAWAVFADNPKRRAGSWERAVGTLIIVFQLFAYRLFAAEAIEDFQAGLVPVMVGHADCVDMGEAPDGNFQCEAEYTNTIDAFVAFFMLSIFLAPDLLQSVRVIRDAPLGTPFLFACLAGIEVVSAFMAASIAVSYHLFIGEVTDAVEVGVGLLFIRELSQQTYSGIRYGKSKQYRNFFITLGILVTLGMILDPLCARIFAGYIQ